MTLSDLEGRDARVKLFWMIVITHQTFDTERPNLPSWNLQGGREGRVSRGQTRPCLRERGVWRIFVARFMSCELRNGWRTALLNILPHSAVQGASDDRRWQLMWLRSAGRAVAFDMFVCGRAGIFDLFFVTISWWELKLFLRNTVRISTAYYNPRSIGRPSVHIAVNFFAHMT